jgi:hypothetical protein
MPSASFSRGFGSVIVTDAPCATRKRAMPAAVRPLPSPTMVTRRPAKSRGPISGSKIRVISAGR